MGTTARITLLTLLLGLADCASAPPSVLAKDNQQAGDWDRDSAVCYQRALGLLAASAGMFGRQEAARQMFHACMIERGWYDA